MKIQFITLATALVCLTHMSQANPQKNTADYYMINPDRYLNKSATLYIEDISLIGKVEGKPELTLFTSLTWHGTDPAGTAQILVDTKNAERFYKKYHAEDGYQQSNSIGTKSNAGWKAQRLRCLFLENEGQYYFYVGNINPFKNIKGLITLKNAAGRSIECKILAFKDTKVKVQRSDGKVFTLDINKLDGQSQRIVRNWAKQK